MIYIKYLGRNSQACDEGSIPFTRSNSFEIPAVIADRLKHVGFIIVILAALLPIVPVQAAEQHTDLFTVSGPLTIFHIFTGPDSMSHVEQITLDAVKGTYGGFSLIDAGAQAVKVGYTKDGDGLPFHNANHRTLLIGVQGTMVFETGDGKQYPIGPGNLLLAEDRTGRGHSNICQAPDGLRQCMLLQVTLRDDETGLRMPAPRN
jgi:hypothetical protein